MTVRIALSMLALLSLLISCDDDNVDGAELEALRSELADLRASHGEDMAGLRAEVAALQEEVAALPAAVDLATLTDSVAAQESRLATLEAANLGSRVAAIEADYTTRAWVQAQGYWTDDVEVALSNLAAYLEVDPASNTVVFTGANVHIRSGSGATDDAGTPTGLGNLVIGYGATTSQASTGSHNLVVGDGHEWTSWGGFVAGYGNSITAPFASVGGGTENNAAGTYTAIPGGGSIVSATVDDFTTQTYVDDAVAGVDLSGYAALTYVDDAIAAIDTSSYATQTYVDDAVAGAGIVEGLADYVTVDTSDNAVAFSGANVHVRSGAGSTYAAVNGLGNLVVGYDEDNGDTKTGSHNLVVGAEHSYEASGGLVAGWDNWVTARAASVVGGVNNSASGEAAVVSGGEANTASGTTAAVSGGYGNIASHSRASVSGGYQNAATAQSASVSGGSTMRPPEPCRRSAGVKPT